MTEVRPFIKSANTTAGMMFLVLLALLPPAGAGIFHYGARAALIMGISTLTAVLCELLWEVILRRPVTVNDYSAAVSGLILGMILPPAVPLYFPVIGSAAGMLLAKLPFGGIGRNLLNPAMTGKLLLLLLFRDAMNDFSVSGEEALTPLGQLAGGSAVSLSDMLTGNTAACIGTGSTAAVLVTAVFLLLTGITDLMIPMGSFMCFTLLMIFFGNNGWNPVFLAVQYMGGTFLFTVFVMAQDYSTRPLTRKGRFLYGCGLGAGIAALRLLGYAEQAAVSALAVMNLIVPFLDAHTMPRPFGIRQSRMETRRIRRRFGRAVLRKRRARQELPEDDFDSDILESDIGVSFEDAEEARLKAERSVRDDPEQMEI